MHSMARAVDIYMYIRTLFWPPGGHGPVLRANVKPAH